MSVSKRHVLDRLGGGVMSTQPRSNGLRFLDFFAGFGGSSSGLVEAGFELVTAYNHWEKAVAVHSANHRAADHVQGDLSGYDMRRLPRRVPFLWASPECIWHSPAGGRRRLRATDLDLFDDYVPNDGGERSRATMFDPIRATEARNFDVVVIENVAEVAKWPLFESWLKMWEALGYSWQIVNASAAHVYSATNPPAGQWRDRIYVIFAAKGIKIPHLEPSPAAWKQQAPAGAPQVGKYRQQYVYVCAANQHTTQVVEPYVLPAAAVIDWSDLGVRIGDRDKPLSEKTLRRIEMGCRMFSEPTVFAHSGQTWDAADPAHPGFADPASYWRIWNPWADALQTRQAGGSGDAIAVPPFLMDKYDYDGGDSRRLRPMDMPLGTITASPHGQMVVPPFYTAINHDSDERANRFTDGPLPTRSTKIGDGLAFPPFIPEFYGTGTARDVDQPVGAVTTSHHHGVAIPPEAFLSRQYGSRGDGKYLNTSVSEPTHPITASGGGNHALVIPGRRPREIYEGALPFSLDDVRFRMLGPTEHLRAQRFWEGYDTSAANKSETTKGAGNAVAVNVAHWIGESLAEALGGEA